MQTLANIYYPRQQGTEVLPMKPDPQTCWIGCAHLAGLAQRKCAGKHILGAIQHEADQRALARVNYYNRALQCTAL